jgi:Flp pilus assembly protein TadG
MMKLHWQDKTAIVRRIRHRHPGGSQRRRGAALVEMGLLLSLFVLLVFGCVDFGRFAFTYIIVTNAAREGAYVGASNSYTSATKAAWDRLIHDAVVAEMQALGGFDKGKLQLPPPELRVTIDPDGAPQRRVHVEVGYPFHLVVPWPGLPEGLMLTRVVEMPSIR